MRGFTPDLVIVDIVLPEKDGPETIREIKTAHSDAKIVAVTAYDGTEEKGYLDLAEENQRRPSDLPLVPLVPLEFLASFH